jgi:hypothetical protein
MYLLLEYWKKKESLIEYLKNNDLENIKILYHNFVNNQENNKLLLLAAEYKCDISIFTFLLENGCSANYNDVNGKSILHYMQNITIHELELFISHGLDIHQRFENGKSILHIIKNPDTFKYLISNYTDFNIIDDNKNTPLHCCSQTKTIYTNNIARPFSNFTIKTSVDIELLDYLLELYDVNALNDCNYTILHIFIINKCLTSEIFNKLIAKNIDLTKYCNTNMCFFNYICNWMPDIYWIKEIIKNSPPNIIQNIYNIEMFIPLSYALRNNPKLLFQIYNIFLIHNIKMDYNLLIHFYTFDTKNSFIIFEFLLNYIKRNEINIISEYIQQDTTQDNIYKSRYMELIIKQKKINFKFLFYILKFKNKFRKLLWEKIREPKIKLKYSPSVLAQLLEHNDETNLLLFEN